MVKQRHRHSRKLKALSLISECNASAFAKIVKAQDKRRKVFWTLLVIMGFTAATIQLSLLVRKYLQFQVVEFSAIKDSMPVEFPSISVCNIDPASYRKIESFLKTPNGSVLGTWLDFVNNPRVRFEEQQNAHFSSIRAIYENLGDEVKFISHDLNDFLIHCKFRDENCSIHNFTTFFDANYYRCFTFNGEDMAEKLLMHATGPQNGLSLIISLDNTDSPTGLYGLYRLESNILHSAGVRVVVHAPNTMPSPVKHGFDVPPGYSSSIGLKTVQHSRLPEPYDGCTTEDLKGTRIYRNTYFACIQLCKQRIIKKQCGCISSVLPEIDADNITFCGLIENLKDLMNKSMHVRENDTLAINIPTLRCEQQLLKEMSHDLSYEESCKCFQPCHETTFTKSVSLSYWPQEFYQEDAVRLFYRDNKQNSVQEAYSYLSTLGYMKRLIDINDTRDDTRGDAIIKENIERASKLVRQNFLRLNVYLEDLSVVEYKHLPAYGWPDLLSDIGGTLGFWMGMSVLAIIELMELICRLVLLLFKSEKKMPDDDPASKRMYDHE